MKQNWKPGTLVYPVPAALVTVGGKNSHNIITIAWTGTICSEPPMCYISVRPERYSYSILKCEREFVINLTTEKLARAADWCGVKSGRDHDKFMEMKLTAGKSHIVAAPYIEESPLAIECRVRDILELGTHAMFIANVVNVLADEKYINKKTGEFNLKKAGLIAFAHGNYYALGDLIGKFGWSVQKKRSR